VLTSPNIWVKCGEGFFLKIEGSLLGWRTSLSFLAFVYVCAFCRPRSVVQSNTNAVELFVTKTLITYNNFYSRRLNIYKISSVVMCA
jgi:hypothetical protein